MSHLVAHLVFVACIGAALSLSLPTDISYYGGVVEMPYAQTGTPQERLETNLKRYLYLLDTDTAKFADILVFPEGTLNSVDVPTFVPNPQREKIVPCDDVNATEYESFLVQLSCAAKRLTIYLVINLTEKEKCLNSTADPRPCASNGLNIFNTNVVFDRNGTVISRYRKVNLYEEAKNVTFVPEMSYFDTDFGVRFGQFICFDILFYTPAQKLVLEYGITDFVYPTMWYSQLPFLTALQSQQAWAHGNGVTLLAAGASEPSVGSTGTAVYSKGLFAGMMAKEQPIMSVSVVRIDKLKRSTAAPLIVKRTDVPLNDAMPAATNATSKAWSQDSINMKRDNLELYETVPINFYNSSRLQRRLCYNATGFCCDFDVQWSRYVLLPNDTKSYSYRLGIYDGWREEAQASSNKLKNCALFSCIGEQLSDCGKLFPAADIDNVRPLVTFQRISITGHFPTSTEYLLSPNSLVDTMLPLFGSDFNWSAEPIDTADGPKMNVTYTLQRSMNNLLTFSIYGNYYNGTDLKGSASLSVASITLLLVAALAAIF